MTIIMRKILFFLFLSSIYISSQSQKTEFCIIFPKNTSIKNIEVKTYKELMTFSDTTLAKIPINSDTVFFSLDLKNTVLLFVHYGKQKVKFYAGPDKKTYLFKFPYYQPKTIADSLNPYFQPEEVWAGTQLNDTLNNKIIDFNQEYYSYLNKYFYKIYIQGYNSQIDTFVNAMKKKYLNTSNKFVIDYVTYKLAFLEFVAKKRDIRKITWDYYRHKKPKYFNPAYMELFNEMYKNFFNLYAQTVEGKNIVYAITRGKSPTLIKESLSKRYELAGDDTLIELVTLKGLYDASFPSKIGAFDKLPYKQISITLDSISILTNIPIHRTIAEEIKHKIKKFSFSFKDTFKLLKFITNENKTFIFDNFKGKFSYIGFCNIKGLPCLEQFAITNRIAERYSNVLDVYYIFPKNQKKEVIKYFKKNKLSNLKILYFYENKDIERLNVPVFPRYILVNPYGKIINDTAPLPTENFNSYFIAILRKQN